KVATANAAAKNLTAAMNDAGKKEDATELAEDIATVAIQGGDPADVFVVASALDKIELTAKDKASTPATHTIEIAKLGADGTLSIDSKVTLNNGQYSIVVGSNADAKTLTIGQS